MIRIICDKCDREFEITNIRYFGTSEVTVLAQSCDCGQEAETEIKNLEKENEELYEDVNALEERLEEINNAYDQLETESRELKWKAKYNQLWLNLEDTKEKEIELENDLDWEAQLHQKAIQEHQRYTDQRISNYKLVLEEKAITHGELILRHKTLVLKYDKLRIANGGNYERSVDL